MIWKVDWTWVLTAGFIWTSCQDLKGKILLKAKKIGGLEESFNEMAEDSQTGELSDEDEVADIEEENQHRESVRRTVKVCQKYWGFINFIRFSNRDKSLAIRF